MNKCPSEIIGLIFEEACTDDGLTGRSLSLVSRHIHHASRRRYAFQSIALYRPHQLSAFASLLDKANLEDFRVRHLYITDHRRVWIEYLPGQDREQRLKERVIKDFHINDPSREISSSAILRIFKAASRNLQTLTLLLFDQHDEQLLSDAVSFPNLRELTIHGSGMAHNAQSELPQCLSLRRLHIIQDHSFKRLIPQSVSRLAPLLTHLRISRLLSGMVMPMNLERDLRCMLHPSNAVDATFPQTLERVLVQMLRRSFLDSDGGQDARLQRVELALRKRFKDIAMQDVEGRIVLLQPAVWDPPGAQTGENPVVQFYMDIKAAWQDRVVGSASTVWDVDPSSILASYSYCAETK